MLLPYQSVESASNTSGSEWIPTATKLDEGHFSWF